MTPIAAITLLAWLAAASACATDRERQADEDPDSVAGQRAAAQAQAAAILDSLVTVFHVDTAWATALPRAQVLSEPLSLAYQEAIPRLRQPVLLVGLIDDAWIEASSLRIRMRSVKPSLPSTLFELTCPVAERGHIAGATASTLRTMGLGTHYAAVAHLTDVRPTDALRFEGHMSVGDDDASIEVRPQRIVYGRCVVIRRVPGASVLDFVDLEDVRRRLKESSR